MSTSEIISQIHPPDVQHCTRCSVILPSIASFCGKCGERLKKPAHDTKVLFALDERLNIEQYRITSLIRRIPYVQLSLALDTQQQRPVLIRDINIPQIDTSSDPRIFSALQQEYNLLRQQDSTEVLPIVASFHVQNHLYSISAWPSLTAPQQNIHGQLPRIYTLQDLLQSGVGLPDEQVALNWILRLAKAVEHLHTNELVIGTLDPSTILVDQEDYRGQPALIPSWMPPAVQLQLRQTLNTVNASQISHIPAAKMAFFAPEAKEGQPEIRSDIYSMGAILYFLVTGTAPMEQSTTTSQRLRSPREINPRVHHTLATIILKALSTEPSARFDSVNEFAAALLEQPGQSTVTQRLYYALLGNNRSADKAGTQLTETNFVSDKDNNKTEPIKAVEVDSTTDDDTGSIASNPTQSASSDLSQVESPKIEEEQLNSDHEGETVGSADPEQTIQPAQVEPPKPAEEQLNSDDAGSMLESVDPEQIAETEDEETQQPQSNDPATSEISTDTENASSSESNNADLNLSASSPSEELEQDKRDLASPPKPFAGLIEHVKRFVLGGQPRTNNTVALIETPMRIQANKNYTIRIHIIGRNEPKLVSKSKQNPELTRPCGLGLLTHGDMVHIEVRSALYHNYAYIVQQADVEIPAQNYAAEIIIPMRSIITDSSGTKRERLHIFFTDEQRNSLYEQPFVIELFISNRVPSGQEGHNVLSIPV